MQISDDHGDAFGQVNNTVPTHQAGLR
jgi:hypothetical protein